MDLNFGSELHQQRKHADEGTAEGVQIGGVPGRFAAVVAASQNSEEELTDRCQKHSVRVRLEAT